MLNENILIKTYPLPTKTAIITPIMIMFQGRRCVQTQAAPLPELLA